MPQFVIEREIPGAGATVRDADPGRYHFGSGRFFCRRPLMSRAAYLPFPLFPLRGTVTQIPGIEENALPLFSEVGRDMSRWPTAAHFISWLAPCPDNDISGERLSCWGARGVRNRAGH